MLPEISRRCRSCGAAVRAGARFCPQCGQNMEAGPDAGAADVPAILDSESAREWAPPTKEFSAFVGSSEHGVVGPSGDGAVASSEDGAARGGAEPPAGGLTPEPRGASAETRETAPALDTQAVEVPAVEVPAYEQREVEVTAVETPAAVVGAESAEEARGRVARARAGARERVGRMREEALVVLEEAPDDSGLRFVLTAAALFLIFLVILLLSTTVLR
jgi:hypothetical protein